MKELKVMIMILSVKKNFLLLKIFTLIRIIYH